jgi:starvation-inducible outer membrane lipoprotein
MRSLLIAALLMLSGCTSMPVSVGALGVCFGICKFEIETTVPPTPQSAAAQIGGGLADLLAQKFNTKAIRK